jgi:hypothetical protein
LKIQLPYDHDYDGTVYSRYWYWHVSLKNASWNCYCWICIFQQVEVNTIIFVTVYVSSTLGADTRYPDRLVISAWKWCSVLKYTVELFCNLTPKFSDILWHPIIIYGSKVFLLTKIKPKYSDVLYNPTHFHGPLMCK